MIETTPGMTSAGVPACPSVVTQSGWNATERHPGAGGFGDALSPGAPNGQTSD